MLAAVAAAVIFDEDHAEWRKIAKRRTRLYKKQLRDKSNP